MRGLTLVLCGALLALPAAASAQGAGDAEAAIRAGSQAWAKAWNAGDAAGLAALYAEDAVVMAPGSEPAKGRAAIETHYKGDLQEAAGSTVAIKTLEVMATDMWAVEVGSSVSTGADGAHRDHGPYVAVWKNVDGTWMLYRDIWNSSM